VNVLAGALDVADKLASVIAAVAAVAALILTRAADRSGGRVRPVRRGIRPWPLLALAFVTAAFAAHVARPHLPAWVEWGAAAAAVLTAALHVTISYRRAPLSERVSELLRAQQRQTARHAYQFFDGHVPARTRLYVRQMLMATDAPGPSRTDLARLDAERVVTGGGHVMVVAGAGGGKSTLAAAVVDTCGRYWLTRRSIWPRRRSPLSRVVAVYLPATDLVEARSLPSAIAAACCRDLEVQAEPAWFTEPPAPGASWLVLVDGVDEVRPAQSRSTTLWLLAQAVRDSTEPIRLVVTSRPLPDLEFAELRDAGAVPYELLPFDQSMLEDFARRLFTGQPTIDPTAEARRFVNRIDSARSAAAVRTPLLATIAGLVYLRDRSSPLPIGRFELYERFVTHLSEGRTGPTAAVRPTCLQLIAQGGEAAKLGHWLNDNFPGVVQELLNTVADDRICVPDTDVVEAGVQWASENLPGGPGPPLTWPGVVTELLVATGLLQYQRGRLEFGHHSFAEFLAARHRLAGLSAERWLTMAGQPAERGTALFAAAGLSHIDDVVIELVERDDAVLAGEVIAEGVTVTDQVRTAVVDLLVDRVATEHDDAPTCLRLLRELPHAAEMSDRLAALAADTMRPSWLRVYVADSLADLDRASGVALLHRIAADQTLSQEVRHLAVLRLQGRGEPVPFSVELATKLEVVHEGRTARHEPLGVFGRHAAAQPGTDRQNPGLELRLAELSAQEGDNDRLQALATMRDRSPRHRLAASRALADITGEIQPLLTLARDPRVPMSVRLHACQHPAVLASPDAHQLLHDLVADPHMGNVAILGAGQLLARLGDTGVLAALSEDPRRYGPASVFAAEYLARQGDLRPLTQLCANHRAGRNLQRLAAVGLARAGGPIGAAHEALRRQLGRAGPASYTRLRAAITLTELNDPAGERLLRRWATSRLHRRRIRTTAALHLASLRRDHSALHHLANNGSWSTRFLAAHALATEFGNLRSLTRLATDPTAPTNERLWAASRLPASTGTPVVRAIAQDKQRPVRHRIKAAAQLASHDTEAAIRLLAGLVNDTDQRPWHRLNAATVLLYYDPSAAVDGLHELTRAPGTSRVVGILATLQLAERGDPRARAALRTRVDGSIRPVDLLRAMVRVRRPR
jgi:hypothetical protein